MIKRFFYGIIVLIIAGICLLIAPYNAHATATTLDPGSIVSSISAGSLASAIGAGTEYALLLGPKGTPVITWQTVYSAAPSTVTVLLEGSLDGSNWVTLSTSTVASGESKTVTGSYKFIRANNSAVTGGTGKTLTVNIVYTNQLVTPTTDSPSHYRLVTVNSGIINSLTSTTGYTLVPGVSGHFYFPRFFAVTKSAGTAYTVNSSAQIGVGHIGLGAYFGMASTGLFDQTSTTKKYRTVGAITSPDNTASYDGFPLGIMIVSSGSLSGSGSDVTIFVIYDDVIVP